MVSAIACKKRKKEKKRERGIKIEEEKKQRQKGEEMQRVVRTSYASGNNSFSIREINSGRTVELQNFFLLFFNGKGFFLLLFGLSFLSLNTFSLALNATEAAKNFSRMFRRTNDASLDFDAIRFRLGLCIFFFLVREQQVFGQQ
jgi:hypothetical protein